MVLFPKVSLIVPVFNVEDYIEQCLDSLIAQDLTRYEIIVVNDGSTDETQRIVEQYAKRHSSIRVVNQENRGLSAARNIGLQIARGKFVGFVDGDDWVDKRTYRTLYSRATASGAEIAIMNGQLYDHDSGNLRPIQDAEIWKTLAARNSSLCFLRAAEPDLFMLDTSACKRMFNRRFLSRNNFRFMEGKIFEDIPAHFFLLLRSKTVVLVNEPFYFYRTRRPGRITARNDDSLFQIFDVMERVISDLRSSGADDVVWANFIWFQHWVLRWLNNQIDSKHKSEFRSRVKRVSTEFGQEAIEEFFNKFAGNKHAIEFVTEQLN